MKYIFEVYRPTDDTTAIRISLVDDSGHSTQPYIIKADDKNPTKYGEGNDVSTVLHKLLDNVRLTVNERKEAEYKLESILTYVKLSSHDVIDTSKNILIAENEEI